MLSAIRTAARTVGHEDRLSTVAHLDELRTRLIASLVVVGVAFGFCFWQNHQLLHLIDRPLARQTQAQVRAAHGPLGATYTVAQSARDVAVQLHSVVSVLSGPGEHATPAATTALDHVASSLERDIERLSVPPQGDKPVTLGIGEPFTTTVTISFIFALILALPFVLYQAYAFLMPAFEPGQRRHILPLVLSIPFEVGVLLATLVERRAAARARRIEATLAGQPLQS